MSALSIKCIFEAFDEAARQRRLGSGGLHLSSRPQQAGFQPTSKPKPNSAVPDLFTALRGSLTRQGGWVRSTSPVGSTLSPQLIISEEPKPDRVLSTSFEKTCKHHCKHLFSELDLAQAGQRGEFRILTRNSPVEGLE